MFATLFQHCCTVLRKKSSLRTVQCNITLKGKSYVCFDICGCIERASSRGHRAGMQFPQKCCPLCDEKVIATTLGQIGINFTCIFKVFPKMPSSQENFENKSEIYSELPSGPCDYIYKPFLTVAPLVNTLFRFPSRWRLSSYFACVNSLPYNWQSPFKCKLATKGPKQKWPNEKALMFLSHRVSFLQIQRGEILNRRES